MLNERDFRESAFRDEITTDFKAGRIGIENGWLVEYVEKQPCGAEENGYCEVHTPSYGTVPLFDLWDVMGI